MTAIRMGPAMTTRECFVEFVSHNPGAVEILAEFCQTDIAVIKRWQGRFLPDGGLLLLRLRCCMHLHGYNVAALSGLKSPILSLALAISRGSVTPDMAVAALDWDLKRLWLVLLRGELPRSDEMAKIERFNAAHSIN